MKCLRSTWWSYTSLHPLTWSECYNSSPCIASANCRIAVAMSNAILCWSMATTSKGKLYWWLAFVAMQFRATEKLVSSISMVWACTSGAQHFEVKGLIHIGWWNFSSNVRIECLVPPSSFFSFSCHIKITQYWPNQMYHKKENWSKEEADVIT